VKSGKTVGCLVWIIEQALLQGRRGDQFWWVAPVDTQAHMAFRRAKDMLTPKACSASESRQTIRLPNGAVIAFRSADAPDSLYGEDVRAVVIDEATRCKEEAWHAIRSTVTATRGAVRIIGNVRGRRNWAYRLARSAEDGEDGMHYARLTASDAIQAGIFDQAELDAARRCLPESVYQELYCAVPSDDQGNPFGLAAIAACIQPLSPDEPVVWGWDVARSVDWTVGIALDAQGGVCRIERFQCPWEETIRGILSVTGTTPALVDSTGVGDAILDRLQRSDDHEFEGYKFSAVSKQRLMEALAIAIHEGRVRFPDGPIRLELECFEYAYTQMGVHYSAPEGMHDDCVCALALALQHYTGRVGRPLRLITGMEDDEETGENYITRRLKKYGFYFPGDENLF
jgi:hypothetical protein